VKHSGHINNLEFTYCRFGSIAVGIFGGCPPTVMGPARSFRRR